ncbi:DUF5721 family protein [Defluviitalea saccharophila]|uniref:DUF5721 family protein n=1 Tax=Defluviitalea saccharophila TaxID=879970 RepID=A0ABZ2Y642_9FIRM|nr:hypothetical protein [Candidatus Epulonipiscium sp.]
MITLNIIDVKKTMGMLLKGDLFDDFEVRTVEVHTFTKFNIDGILNKSFFDTDEREMYTRNYVLWEEIKPYVFNIIKGEKTPTYFKFVLSANGDTLNKFSKDVSALFINLIYSQEKLTCTTGVALKNFVLDKSDEYEWDEYIRSFFREAQIFVE